MRIASGNILPFTTVTAHLTSGGGTLIETAADFLDRQFGALNNTVASTGANPVLDQSRSAAKTDREGIATFKLLVTEGIEGSYSIYVQVCDKKDWRADIVEGCYE